MHVILKCICWLLTHFKIRSSVKQMSRRFSVTGVKFRMRRSLSPFCTRISYSELPRRSFPRYSDDAYFVLWRHIAMQLSFFVLPIYAGHNKGGCERAITNNIHCFLLTTGIWNSACRQNGNVAAHTECSLWVRSREVLQWAGTELSVWDWRI